MIKGLYGIVDSHAELAHLMLLGGCRVLQLRMKHSCHSRERGNPENLVARDPRWSLPSNDLIGGGDDSSLWNQRVFEEACKIIEFKKKYDFTFIVNDYAEVAGEVGADGVHLGENDLPIEDARKMLGNDFIIGYSSHSIDEAINAARRGADYVAFGAIFPTKTKGPGHPVQGIEKLKEVVSKINKPVVAIGGINRTNIDSVISTNVSAVAMITGITQAKNIVDEVKWYVEKLCQRS